MTKELINQIWKDLEEVKDPEIPVISVVDLGMITGIDITEEDVVIINMTPTFAACPAIDVLRASITKQIKDKLAKYNLKGIEVKVSFDVQWNSNLITEKGKKVLKEFGLAPPPAYVNDFDTDVLSHVPCPFCDSTDTEMKSTFGSTLCRSIHYCNSCRQGFEQFKPL